MTGPPILALPDGTAWPNPSAVADLQWRLRYHSQTTRQDAVFAGTACTAYQELIWLPRRRRETAVRLIRAATPPWDDERPSEPPVSLEVGAEVASSVAGSALAAVLAQLDAEADEADRLSHTAGTPVMHASTASAIRMAVYRVRETLAGRAPAGGEW